MNLIARCPSCHTCYKVVPDQLRISEGWVRCGQCSEVFDASQQLTEAGGEHAPNAFADADNDLTQTLQVMLAGSAEVKSQTSSFPEAPWATASLFLKPSSDADSDVKVPDLVPSPEPVSFMSVSDSGSRAYGRGKAGLWWALGAALMLGLLAQGLYREREWLAAHFPEMKPALVSACAVLGCRLAPIQRIEKLEIESATFRQVDQEIFELHFAVKNKATFALALPAIELTLTDLADQPVMRRVFLPAEMGAKLASVPQAGEWSAANYLRIRTDTPGVRAQGYRLLIFYP